MVSFGASGWNSCKVTASRIVQGTSGTAQDAPMTIRSTTNRIHCPRRANHTHSASEVVIKSSGASGRNSVATPTITPEAAANCQSPRSHGGSQANPSAPKTPLLPTSTTSSDTAQNASAVKNVAQTSVSGTAG